MSTTDSRDEMFGFWKEHSRLATQEEMMLDSNAAVMSEHEVPEILGMLPDVQGKDVLDLGAGIGRYTEKFSINKANSVLAVDFMETLCEKNILANGHRDNVQVMQADATQLTLNPSSLDLVFSNWLLMYLNDDEVRGLLNSALSWLKEDGCLFFRESCFHQSGNKSRTTNPTKYRTPQQYNHLLNSVVLTEAKDGKVQRFCYEIFFTKSVKAYIKFKHNRNQLCWLVKKVPCNSPVEGYRNLQEYLDCEHYSKELLGIQETIMGRNYLSSGGVDIDKKVFDMFSLNSNDCVLDVGCGIGGSSFLMVECKDVQVNGLDLSANAISLAIVRANELEDDRVQFEVGDVLKVEYEVSSFDCIYCRESLSHIGYKKALFQNFRDWLRPGGQLVICDYCYSDEALRLADDDLDTPITNMMSLGAYIQKLADAGFRHIQTDNITEAIIPLLNQELNRIILHQHHSDSASQPEKQETVYKRIKRNLTLRLAALESEKQRLVLFRATRDN